MAAEGHLGMTALSRVTLASAVLFLFSVASAPKSIPIVPSGRLRVRPGVHHKYHARMSTPIPTRYQSNNIAFNWRPVGQSCMNPWDRYHQRCVGQPSYCDQYLQLQQQHRDNYFIMPSATRFLPFYNNGAYNWY